MWLHYVLVVKAVWVTVCYNYVVALLCKCYPTFNLFNYMILFSELNSIK